MKLKFTQPIHNALFQKMPTVENYLPVFDMLNVKGILYDIVAWEVFKSLLG